VEAHEKDGSPFGSSETRASISTTEGAFVEIVLPSGLVSSSFAGSYGTECDVSPWAREVRGRVQRPVRFGSDDGAAV